MNYRTEQKEAFIIAGYTQEMKKIEQDENFYEISNIWSNLTEEKINQLMAVTDGTLQGLLGVSDSNKSQKQYRYMIGMNKKQDQTTLDELAETQFPVTKWVIFECIGAISAGVKALAKDQPFEPNVLMRLKQNTHAPWADWEIRENIEIPRIELYPFGDMEADDYKCELWIPIID